MKKSIIDSIGEKLTYWNGGTYSNKNDSRILVPKANPGMGWRINLGNPKAVLLFIITMVAIVGVLIVFSLLFGVQPH
jgi:uncharacterized membrane protein